MTRRLSTCLLFGAILLWVDTSEISRRTGRSVSVRELSIPERASNGYERDQPSGEK